MVWCSEGACRTISAPMIGCCLIQIHSSSVSFPGLLRIWSGTPILPMSCRRAPWASRRSAAGFRPIRTPIRTDHSATRAEETGEGQCELNPIPPELPSPVIEHGGDSEDDSRRRGEDLGDAGLVREW